MDRIVIQKNLIHKAWSNRIHYLFASQTSLSLGLKMSQQEDPHSRPRTSCRTSNTTTSTTFPQNLQSTSTHTRSSVTWESRAESTAMTTNYSTKSLTSRRHSRRCLKASTFRKCSGSPSARMRLGGFTYKICSFWRGPSGIRNFRKLKCIAKISTEKGGNAICIPLLIHIFITL